MATPELRPERHGARSRATAGTPSDTADERGSARPGAPRDIAARHAGTPAETHFDSLGREVIAIAHNRTPSYAPRSSNTPLLDRPWIDERILTFTKLDAEGKPLWICDARGNLVMQYITPSQADRTPLYDDTAARRPAAYELPANAAPCYDIAGNLLFQHSMDAGDRWMLTDAAGQADARVGLQRARCSTTARPGRAPPVRDAVRRAASAARALAEVNDAQPRARRSVRVRRHRELHDGAGDLAARAADRNLIGQADCALRPERPRDRRARRLRRRSRGDHAHAGRRTSTRAVVDWNVADRAALLETRRFIQITEHDALGR